MRKLLAVVSLCLPALALSAETDTVKDSVVAPKKVLEECLDLKPGQVLHYRFQAEATLDFNVHYHEGEKVNFPYPQTALKTLEAQHYTVQLPQTYCLMWKNTSDAPVKLNYVFRVEGSAEKN